MRFGDGVGPGRQLTCEDPLMFHVSARSESSRSRPSTQVGKIASFAFLIAAFGVRTARADKSPSFLQRVTTDVGWFGGYSRIQRTSRFVLRDATADHRARGELHLSGSGLGQGLYLNGTIRVIRRFSVGAEAWYYKHAYALRSPLADGLGIHYGRREYLGLSVAIEYLPLATDYLPRHGWFLQGSVGPYVHFDHQDTGAYLVQSRAPEFVGQVTTSLGYRLPIGAPYSLSVAAFFRIESGAALGLRVAGGLQ